jgi:hypothetical protein
MIEGLKSYPPGAAAWDFETYNSKDSDLAVEPWAEGTFPFMFSVSLIEKPEDYNMVFVFHELNQEQKDAIYEFLTTREVWAFNCKFEMAVIWKMLGKMVKLNDVQVLLKVEGGYVNNLSLKKASAKLLGAPEWAESTWETLNVLKEIVDRVNTWYIVKKKEHPIADLLVKGDMQSIAEYFANAPEDKLIKSDKEFYAKLLSVWEHLTPRRVLSALLRSNFDSKKIGLTYLDYDNTARYCAYDTYATAMCYHALWENCKDQYPIYIKQSWLACVMEAYGLTRDVDKEKQIETIYKEQMLDYMKKILLMPVFANAVEFERPVEIVSEKGRKKASTEKVKGLEIEDKIFIKNCNNYEELKDLYWNYNSPKGSAVTSFYEVLFTSEVVVSSLVAFHMYKFLIQIEGFTEEIDGEVVSIAKRMKHDTCSEILFLAKDFIETQLDISRKALSTFLNGFKFEPWSEFMTLAEDAGVTDLDTYEKLFQEYKKWATARYQYTQCLEETKNIMSELSGSLKAENIGVLFSALTTCADMNVDAPWDEMPWELQLVFGAKVLKKIDKSINNWVTGGSGSDRVRDCEEVLELTEVPARKKGKALKIFRTDFNECSASTKRWRSAVHTIPGGTEIGETFIPRSKESVQVHYDYCWHKDTKLRLLNGTVKTVEELHNEGITSSTYSYDPNKEVLTSGRIKEVRKVRQEEKLIELTLNNGYKLQLTPEHNLYLLGYKKTMARYLKIGDSIISLYDKEEHKDNHTVVNIREVDYNDWVYTIEIEEDHHNYFVLASDDGKEMILSSNSQNEVRVVAAVSRDKNLLDLFKNNPQADVHRLMASQVWGKDPKDVSDFERGASKSVTFGLLYGLSLESLAETHFQGNISQAKNTMDRFFESFPDIKSYIKNQHNHVHKHGYVKTFFGDKLYVDGYNKGSIERDAQNYPIQSTASCLAGYGIWNTYEKCVDGGVKAIPQCFTHDSANWDVKVADFLKFVDIVDKCAMEDIYKEFSIPLKIDFEMGMTQSFMIKMSNIKKNDNGIEFEFEGSDKYFEALLERLSQCYDVKHEIKKTKIKTKSWKDMFTTKSGKEKPYSLYINQPLKTFEGVMSIARK